MSHTTLSGPATTSLTMTPHLARHLRPGDHYRLPERPDLPTLDVISVSHSPADAEVTVLTSLGVARHDPTTPIALVPPF